MTEDAIIRELQRLETRVGGIDKKLDGVRAEDIPNLRADVAALKVKAGVWGFVAGAIPAMTALLLLALKNSLP